MSASRRLKLNANPAKSKRSCKATAVAAESGCNEEQIDSQQILATSSAPSSVQSSPMKEDMNLNLLTNNSACENGGQQQQHSPMFHDCSGIEPLSAVPSFNSKINGISLAASCQIQKPRVPPRSRVKQSSQHQHQHHHRLSPRFPSPNPYPDSSGSDSSQIESSDEEVDRCDCSDCQHRQLKKAERCVRRCLRQLAIGTCSNSETERKATESAKLLSERDAGGLYWSLENFCRHQALAARERLIKHLSAPGLTNREQCRNFVHSVRNELQEFRAAAKRQQSIVQPIEAQHLSEIGISWDLLSQHLFHSLVFACDEVRSVHCQIFELLRPKPDDRETPSPLKVYLDLDSEMTVIKQRWNKVQHQLESWLTRHCCKPKLFAPPSQLASKLLADESVLQQLYKLSVNQGFIGAQGNSTCYDCAKCRCLLCACPPCSFSHFIACSIRASSSSVSGDSGPDEASRPGSDEEAELGDSYHSDSEDSACPMQEQTGKDSKYCDCCYCEVFGHNSGQQPALSNKYMEKREQLRRKLIMKKESKKQQQRKEQQQREPPIATLVASNLAAANAKAAPKANDGDIDELVKFIEGGGASGAASKSSAKSAAANSKREAKKARQRAKKVEEMQKKAEHPVQKVKQQKDQSLSHDAAKADSLHANAHKQQQQQQKLSSKSKQLTIVEQQKLQINAKQSASALLNNSNELHANGQVDQTQRQQQQQQKQQQSSAANQADNGDGQMHEQDQKSAEDIEEVFIPRLDDDDDLDPVVEEFKSFVMNSETPKERQKVLIDISSLLMRK